PQLARVHLAEALVALEREAFSPGVGYRLEQADGAVDHAVLVLAAQRGRPRIDLLQRRGMLVELARVCRAEQRMIENGDLFNPAHGALEAEPLAILEFALPTALRLFGPGIKPARDIFRRLSGVARVAENIGREHARDRRLLDHLAIVAAVQSAEHVADHAR